MRLQLLSAVFLSLLFFTTDTLANGAVTYPGVGGGNLVLYNGKPAHKLIVDEFVDIDLVDNLINVSYVVENPTQQVITLPMAFPVALINGSCERFKNNNKSLGYIEDDVLYQDFDFEARHNNQLLSTQYKSLSDIKLPADYRSLTRN